MNDQQSDVLALMLTRSVSVPETVPSPVRVLGIDLGTTNSTVAEVVWRRGQKEPVSAHCLEGAQPTDTGSYTHILVPSVVAVSNGQIWVGEGAKRLRADARLRMPGPRPADDVGGRFRPDVPRRTTHAGR